MTTDIGTTEKIHIPGAPDIPGLSFRHFRGEPDFPGMLAVLEGSRIADGIEDTGTLETMARTYNNLKNCDPHDDIVMIEVDGELVGYKRVLWWLEDGTGTYVYGHFGFLLPEWRGKGIGRALIRHSEARIREISKEHPHDAPRTYDVDVSDTQKGLEELINSEGYAPVRHWYEMVRPDLENIPEVPMPEGLEVRPVKPEDMRTIWEAEVEAFRDHWGASVPDEADFRSWLNEPISQPELWQVAWDGDQVAGMVRNYINEAENKKFGRKRGYVENISTRRPWRKRGLASALIARSFKMHKDLGMTEAALGVDTENPSGALRVYERMGFRAVKGGASYRKPFTL